jgi:uncharacterized membrane protein YfcA
LSGLLGIGGGALMVPAMVFLLSTDQHTAQGVSLVVIVPTAIVGAATHYRQGYVLPRLAFGLGLAAVVGALAGAWASGQVDAVLLRRAFGLFITFVGGRMAVEALRTKR